MDTLRILHVALTSRLAGSERYCVDLANHQAGLGHDVHVAGAGGSPIATALDARVRFHAVRRPFFGAWQVRRLVRELGPDVCHAHLSAACKAVAGAPGPAARVATLHVGYKPRQHRRLDAVICVNHAQSAHIDDFPGLVRTIPNWLPRSDRRLAPSRFRAELGVPAGAFLVGAVGRLHPSKGMDVLIEAFRAAAPATAALAIVGEGPQRSELLRQAGGDPRIRFAGYRSDVRACLEQFDLFVSPSREESFGLAIIEAMSAGLPIISTTAEGPAEFLRDQPVTLVPTGSVDRLTDAIARAAARFAGGELPRVGYDLSEFDAAARVGSIVELYRQALAIRGRRPVEREAVVAMPS